MLSCSNILKTRGVLVNVKPLVRTSRVKVTSWSTFLSSENDKTKKYVCISNMNTVSYIQGSTSFHISMVTFIVTRLLLQIFRHTHTEESPKSFDPLEIKSLQEKDFQYNIHYESCFAYKAEIHKHFWP